MESEQYQQLSKHTVSSKSIKKRQMPSSDQQPSSSKKPKLHSSKNKEVSEPREGGQAPPPPTCFLSLQISNSRCHHAIKKAQEAILEISDPAFHRTMVPVAKSHITLFVFNLDQDGEIDHRLPKVISLIEGALEEWWCDDDFINLPVTLKLNEVGHFDRKVIFVKPQWNDSDDLKPLTKLWKILAGRLNKEGFISERRANFDLDFKPHVTLCKMGKVRKWKQIKQMPKHFPVTEIFDAVRRIDFGQQMVTSMQLMSMTKPPTVDPLTNGLNYHCHKEFTLFDNWLEFGGRENPTDHDWCCRKPLLLPAAAEAPPQSEPQSPSNGPGLPLLLLATMGGLLGIMVAARYVFRT